MASNRIDSSGDKLKGVGPHRFLVLKKLGQGTYGKVQLALNKETNEKVAIKVIKKSKIENKEDMKRIRREIHIMASIRHPHIIHINEVFETKQEIVIVMNYASGGELYDYLGCHKKLPEDETRRIFRQIASAIYHCHKNNICHRDLKLENILLDEEGNAQIADFGLSNIFDDTSRMNTFCGSPLYASPEIVKGIPYCGPEVDCWSLGVLLYTLVYGTMPFDGHSFKDLVQQINEGRYKEPVNKSGASCLIRHLLTPNIAQRATIIDVCKDKWINQGYITPLIEVVKNYSAKNNQKEELLKLKRLRKDPVVQEKNQSANTSLMDKNNKQNLSLFCGPKSSYYGEIYNDVQFVMNKLLTTVETLVTNSNSVKQNHSQMKEENYNPISTFPTFQNKQNCKKDLTATNLMPFIKPINESFIPSEMPVIPHNVILNQDASSYEHQNDKLRGCNRISDKQNKVTKGRKQHSSYDTKTPNMRTLEQDNQKTNKTFQQCQNSFKKSKFHVLHLACLLSQNFERLKRNSFIKPKTRKKVPGKIVIPPTFDPNAFPKKSQEKKDLLIFPIISVSENKEKIQQKIEKIRKTALNNSLIIRSDSRTRLKIKQYIESQVKKAQNLVNNEQNRIHLNIAYEKSQGGISKFFYEVQDRESADSGIGNSVNEEFFCFICSNHDKASCTALLQTIKDCSSYISNHLHIPKDNKFGAVSRWKSLTGFSRTYNSLYFSEEKGGKPKVSDSQNAFTLNTHILRSSSYSAGLDLYNGFKVVMLNSDYNDTSTENKSSHLFDSALLSGCEASMAESFKTLRNKAHNSSRSEKDFVVNSGDCFLDYSNYPVTKNEKHTEICHSKSCNSFSKLRDHFTRRKSRRSSVPILTEINDNKSKCKHNVKCSNNSETPILNSFSKEHILDKKYHKLNIKRIKTAPCITKHGNIDLTMLCHTPKSMKSPSYSDLRNSSNLTNRNSFRYNELEDQSNFASSLNNDFSEKFLFKHTNSATPHSQNIYSDTIGQVKNLDLHLTSAKSIGALSDFGNGVFMSTETPLSEYDFDDVHTNSAFLSNFFKKRNKINKERKSSSKTLSPSKPKRKSFSQLMALKRIQEAQKELQDTPKTEIEDETCGSLLEALKTHGYKGVIDQRFNESQNPYYMNCLKNPRKLKAEIAQLNSMYYESLPRYVYDETDYVYDNLYPQTSRINTISSLYNIQRMQMQNNDQINTYFNNDSLYSFSSPEDFSLIVNPESFDELKIPEIPKGQILKDRVAEETPMRDEYDILDTENETQESVHDRIWRKSFYSRFNNRVLSRKEKSAIAESNLKCYSQIGQLSSDSKTTLNNYDLDEPFRIKKTNKHLLHFDD